MIKDTLVTFATRVALFALSSLVGIFTARLLGPDGRGVYYIVVTYMGALILLGCLGLEVSNVYFGARRPEVRAGMFWNSLISGVALGGMLIVVGWALFSATPGAFKEISPALMAFALLGLPCMMVSRFLLGLILGVQHIVAYNALSLVERGLIVALFLLLLPSHPEVAVAIGAYVLVQLVLAVAAVGYLGAKGLAGRSIAPNIPLLRLTIPFGLKFQMGNILQFLNYRLAAFVLNYFINPAQVGIYSIALVLGESLWHLSNSAATVILPRVSRSQSPQESAALASRSTRLSLASTAALGAGLAVASPWLIRLLFGSDYSSATAALAILLPGVVIFSAANVLASYIAGSGYPQYNTMVAAVSLGVVAVGNLSLVPNWGINGAALASTLSYVTTAVGSLYFYRRLSGYPIGQALIPRRQDLLYVRDYVAAIWRLKQGRGS